MRNEKILVVDDDQLVRESIAKYLRLVGFQVLEADNADRALELVERNQPVDLIVADMVMPRKSGADLAKEVRTRWPATKLFFMSGYTRSDPHLAKVIGSGDVLLQKPMSIRSIVDTIEELLKSK